MKLLFLFLLFPFSIQAQTIVKTQTASGISVNASGFSTLSNTTTETTIFSYPIMAGELGNSKEINLEIMMNVTSLLVVPNMTIRVKMGGQTLTMMSGININISQTNGLFQILGKIANKNSSSAQYAYSAVKQESTIGPLASAPYANADWTVDCTVDQTLTVTVQFGSAISTTVLTPKYIKLKIE